MRLYSIVFLATAALVAAVFWHFFGRSLQYDIYAGGVFSHSEDFSQSFRIVITTIVAVVFAALPTWLVYAFRHDYRRGTNSNEAGNA